MLILTFFCSFRDFTDYGISVTKEKILIFTDYVLKSDMIATKKLHENKHDAIEYPQFQRKFSVNQQCICMCKPKKNSGCLYVKFCPQILCKRVEK